jgi:hypothetical protein
VASEHVFTGVVKKYEHNQKTYSNCVQKAVALIFVIVEIGQGREGARACLAISKMKQRA